VNDVAGVELTVRCPGLEGFMLSEFTGGRKELLRTFALAYAVALGSVACHGPSGSQAPSGAITDDATLTSERRVDTATGFGGGGDIPPNVSGRLSLEAGSNQLIATYATYQTDMGGVPLVADEAGNFVTFYSSLSTTGRFRGSLGPCFGTQVGHPCSNLTASIIGGDRVDVFFTYTTLSGSGVAKSQMVGGTFPYTKDVIADPQCPAIVATVTNEEPYELEFVPFPGFTPSRATFHAAATLPGLGPTQVTISHCLCPVLPPEDPGFVYCATSVPPE